MCDSKSYNKCFKCSLSALTQAHNRLSLVYCRVDNTLFEVSPEIRCSGVSRTGISLELLTDIDMLLMFKDGIRGGVATATHRFGRGNNRGRKRK